MLSLLLFFFFFNDTATTEIYTLSLHDALPICMRLNGQRVPRGMASIFPGRRPCPCCYESINCSLPARARPDRKSTRLNSSHLVISYAVFCLKKKKKKNTALRVVHTQQHTSTH